MLHCSPYGGVEKLTMFKKIEKVSTDYSTRQDVYRFEKDYVGKTYSYDYRVDKDLLYNRKISSYEEDVMQQFAQEVSLEMDAQIIEQLYSETGWIKVGKIKEDDQTLIWIRENIRRGYTRLPNGVYWFQSKDEAAWFRMMFS